MAKKSFEEIKRDFELFGKGVERLNQLSRELDSLNLDSKFPREVANIRSKLKGVHNIPEIERRLAELKGKGKQPAKKRLKKKSKPRPKLLSEVDKKIEKVVGSNLVSHIQALKRDLSQQVEKKLVKRKSQLDLREHNLEARYNNLLKKENNRFLARKRELFEKYRSLIEAKNIQLEKQFQKLVDHNNHQLKNAEKDLKDKKAKLESKYQNLIKQNNLKLQRGRNQLEAEFNNLVKNKDSEIKELEDKLKNKFDTLCKNQTKKFNNKFKIELARKVKSQFNLKLSEKLAVKKSELDKKYSELIAKKQTELERKWTSHKNALKREFVQEYKEKEEVLIEGLNQDMVHFKKGQLAKHREQLNNLKNKSNSRLRYQLKQQSLALEKDYRARLSAEREKIKEQFDLKVQKVQADSAKLAAEKEKLIKARI